MKGLLSLSCAALALMTLPLSVKAADFGGYRSDYCIDLTPSPILDLSTTEDMRAEVERRYAHAVDVSYAEPTVYSSSPRYPWAAEAKISCGMAIGFFRGREVNEEMISKCDCHYSRMLRYTH